MLVVALIGIIGTFTFVTSHAAKSPGSLPSYSNLHGSQVATTKSIANEYWGGSICGPHGQDIKLIYYSSKNYFKKIQSLTLSNQNSQIQYDFGIDHLAYAHNRSGLNKNPEYCRIYINSDAMRYQYYNFAGPINHLTAAQLQCESIVHETGHLNGYYDPKGVLVYDAQGRTYFDHAHSPNPNNIMYPNSTRTRGAFTGAPRCYAELH